MNTYVNYHRLIALLCAVVAVTSIVWFALAGSLRRTPRFCPKPGDRVIVAGKPFQLTGDGHSPWRLQRIGYGTHQSYTLCMRFGPDQIICTPTPHDGIATPSGDLVVPQRDRNGHLAAPPLWGIEQNSMIKYIPSYDWLPLQEGTQLNVIDHDETTHEVHAQFASGPLRGRDVYVSDLSLRKQ